jgi:hypothetical protein
MQTAQDYSAPFHGLLWRACVCGVVERDRGSEDGLMVGSLRSLRISMALSTASETLTACPVIGTLMAVSHAGMIMVQRDATGQNDWRMVPIGLEIKA